MVIKGDWMMLLISYLVSVQTRDADQQTALFTFLEVMFILSKITLAMLAKTLLKLTHFKLCVVLLK